MVTPKLIYKMYKKNDLISVVFTELLFGTRMLQMFKPIKQKVNPGTEEGQKFLG
jgi:hypothetical protein